MWSIEQIQISAELKQWLLTTICHYLHYPYYSLLFAIQVFQTPEWLHKYQSRREKYFKINTLKMRFHCLYVKLATVPKFLQKLSVLLTRDFHVLNRMGIASSWRPNNAFSFNLCWFCLFWTVIQSFPWSMFTYNLINCKQSLLPSKILSEEHKTSNCPSITLIMMWDRLQL